MAKTQIKGKKKIGCLIAILVIAAIVTAIFLSARSAGKKLMADSVYTGDLYIAATRDVSDTVSATGLIESDESTTAKVYSTLAYKIATVEVELGDHVEAGDVLCLYETETLDRQIKEKELSMSSSERASALNLATARLNYESYLEGMHSGTNASVHNAQSSLAAAQDNYQRAYADYEEYKQKIADGEIVSLNTAARNLEQAQSDYDEQKAKLDAGDDISLNAAKRNLDLAQKNYDDLAAELDGDKNISLHAAARSLEQAKKNYTDLKEKIDNGTHTSLVTAKRTLDTAKKNYNDYKSLVKSDETADLAQAAAAVDSAYAAHRAAAATLNTLKGELSEYRDALAAEQAKPAEEQDAERISALTQRIAAKEEEVAEQQTTVTQLLRECTKADDAYDAVYRMADNTLESYKTAYENAQDNYDAAVDSLNTTLESYERAVKDAQDNYDTVKKNLTDQLDAYARAVRDAQDNYDTVAKSLDDAFENYARALQTAKENYQTAKEQVDSQLENYETALHTASRNVGDAENALTNAKSGADDTLENYRISYENAKNNTDTALADYQLANLYVDLAKTTVTAPIGGTVTAVYAVEGETASGVLFVIEDTENLVVTSTVKAYDLEKVSVGMRVKIKTDATGTEVFEGILDSVAPTAVKDAAGGVMSTNDAEFETVVRISEPSERLKIGVSARIEYVTADAPNAIGIPESAVLSEAGKTYVLKAETVSAEGGEEKVALTKTEIACGVSDGVYVAVKGILLGDTVVDNVENYRMYDGKTVAVSPIDKNASVLDMNAMMNMSAKGGR